MKTNTTIYGSGSAADTASQVDPTHSALRASIRPLEHGGGGHYAIGTQTGLMAAGIASAAQIFQVRWADPMKSFVLKKLVIQCSTSTGFAATTVGAPLEFILGHGSSANGSGGTALAPTSLGNKMDKNMATPSFASFGEIRIATTAALTAATGQVLEPAPMAACAGADNRTLVSTMPMTLFELRDQGDHPCVLDNGDTLVIRTNSPAATGTWTMFLTMTWAEIAVGTGGESF